jgi:UDP-N-acetylglucosamine 2-epimerase
VLIQTKNHQAVFVKRITISLLNFSYLQRIEERRFVFHGNVRQLKPFGFFDYNQLQKNAYCVLSDSGTLSEESALMGFPGVLIRTSTERPEHRLLRKPPTTA